MRIAVAVAAALFALAGTSVADETNAAVRKQTNIPAQPLGSALETLARDRNFQLVYLADTIGALHTGGAVGELTIDEALTQLLSDTGLSFKYLDEKTITISIANAEEKAAEGERPTAMAVGGQRAIRLAQVDETQGPTQTGVDGEGDAKYYRSGGVAVPEVLIEGSRILNVDIPRSRDDAQPYVVFTREKIDQSGAANLEDFLKNQLPMNTDAVAYSQDPAFGDFGNTSSINLRGLRANQTLILVDGRRIAGWNYSGTPQQADINGIPWLQSNALKCFRRLHLGSMVEVQRVESSTLFCGAITQESIHALRTRTRSTPTLPGDW